MPAEYLLITYHMRGKQFACIRSLDLAKDQAFHKPANVRYQCLLWPVNSVVAVTEHTSLPYRRRPAETPILSLAAAPARSTFKPSLPLLTLGIP